MNTKSFFVKPAAGLRILWPSPPFTRALAEAGEYVPDTPFWRARLACGDVLLIDDPAIGESRATREE